MKFAPCSPALIALFVLLQSLVVQVSSTAAVAHNPDLDVNYNGICRDGIETFFSIPYGQDTGGEQRFKPPRPYVPVAGSTINALSAGPACPQAKGDLFNPLYLLNITDVSEDCLHLNVYRAQGTAASDSLPVMLYIHGGSFYIGSKDELTIQPGGLILRSVEMGHPVVFVTINYRLGGTKCFQVLALTTTDSMQSLDLHSLKHCRRKVPRMLA